MEISIPTPTAVLNLIKSFEKQGFEIYVVGGMVRDAMLSRTIYDWDFTTSATPEEIMKIVPDSYYDNSFGTVGVKTDGRPYEITTFRTEKKYSNFRHPDEVSWGTSLEEDLKRRDFTINAMALKRISGSGKTVKYQVIDLYDGMADLKSRLVRTVGDPNERFGEDALRMMRGVRIAAQLGFSIEEQTFLAIKANADSISAISAERIRDELLKIMGSDYPADGYMILHSVGLGEKILPEVEKAFGVEQKSPGRHHIYDVGTHSVESLRHCPSTDPITRLATLVHDLGKVRTQRIAADGKITFYNHEMESERIAVDIAERLRFSNEQKEKFVRLVRWHQFTVDERQTDNALRRFIRNVGVENIAEIIALRTGDRLGGGARETSWRLEEFKRRLVEVQKQPFAVSDLKVNGVDVMGLKNIAPGPKVGEYLNTLFAEVENGLPNEREDLIERLKQMSL
jgi:tRNA nucleotidyltransferase/poly(A) polymerase